MNILELQDNLKDLPDSALMKEMQMPSGNAPQFLVLSELKRRKRMRDEFNRQEASNMPTVAEETVTAAGMPQQGIMQAARAMAPNTNMAQNTGMDTAAPVPATRAPQQPQMMADGGVLRLNQGSALSLEDLRALKAERRRLGVNDPHVITSIAAEDPFNPMTQYSTEKFGDLDLMQIAAMLQRGGNRDGLIANFGADAVREAESMLSDQSYLSIGQLPLGLGGQFGTLSKRELRQRPIKSYRDPSQSTYLGGEGIGSISTDVEDFTAPTPVGTNYTGQGGTLPAELNHMQSMLASDPITRIQADRAGISVDEYISQMSPEARAQNLLRASGQGPEFDKAADLAAYGEFMGTPSIYRPEAGMPSQEDLDLRAQEVVAADVFPNDVSSVDTDAAYNAAQEQRRANAARMMEINEIPTEKPTFAGDVLPFLGDASVAAGKSLYDSFFPQKTVGPDDVIAELREQEAMRNADPIQDEINRLRAIISNPDASAPEKANAADDLMKLQERIAVTQTGGNIAATVEGQGIELEAPYIMGPFGPMIDPNYKTPGKTGQSIVDAAALQGTDALKEIEDTNLYPDNVIREAEKVATLSDYEAAINPINKNIMDVQNNLKNPYLPDDARAELETFLETAQQQKNELVNQTGVDELFVPPSVENVPSIIGGYEGLIDTSPVITTQPAVETTTIAEQAAEAAAETTTEDQMLEASGAADATYPATVTTDDDPNKKLPVTDPDPPGFGSTDSRIAKMLAERQKQSESDKWMALAQAGFQIMGSKSPTLLGAIGEGGQAGLKALSASKKGKQAFDADMLKLQTQLDIANIRSQSTSKLAPAALVTAAESAVKRAQTAFDNARTQAEKLTAKKDLEEAKTYLNEITSRVASQFAATANIPKTASNTRTQV